MVRYEEKIAIFARDKQFLRLSRPVLGRADAVRDACGSTQPRTLYGLTDVETGRHHFVGDSCLKELVKRGAILRRFGKQSGNQAYDEEMQLRAGPSSAGPVPTDGATISSQIRMFETQEHYQCFVALICGGAGLAVIGTACIAKYEEHWGAGGASGWVLQNLKQERPDAPIRCLAQAWQEAYAQLTVPTEAQMPSTDGLPNGQFNNVILSPAGVLKLRTLSAVESQHGP